ncbi:hypothetical protein KIN20_001771 [Parelaphostrongylus tenuis]|uniref:Uncharacterized protein n=1 Tax=Parelaphostrongylus tenuis TaxID=148309 RepID=A0AAD5QGC2_PARTN|nr:hypothetical protein KIN20_001771 [Parelaphostrongylus tenuis]
MTRDYRKQFDQKLYIGNVKRFFGMEVSIPTSASPIPDRFIAKNKTISAVGLEKKGIHSTNVSSTMDRLLWRKANRAMDMMQQFLNLGIS